MSSTYKISDMAKIKDRGIFFDANVLIYINWPTGSLSFEKKYSSMFNRILKQKNKKYIDFIVVSEVVNRAMRTEYDKHLQINKLSKDKYTFKTYRNSKDGKKALDDIFQIVTAKILKYFDVTRSSFSKADIINFLSGDKSIDINDKAIADICRNNNLILFTNDKDFKNSNIDILTSNPALLKA